MQLNILSWNIMQGGGSRTFSIVNTIAKLAPDFIILSEFKANASGYQLIDFLRNCGFTYFNYFEQNSTENSVLIAAKMQGNDVSIPLHVDETFRLNVKASDFGTFTLVGVYLPHKKKHLLFDPLQKMHDIGEQLHIMAGDFNTGINGIDQVGNSFWYEKEFKALTSSGMTDAFRHVHQDVKEYSWYSHQGNGFRYDHTLIDHRMLPFVTECDYHHIYRKERISDHAPMVLKLEV